MVTIDVWDITAKYGCFTFHATIPDETAGTHMDRLRKALIDGEIAHYSFTKRQVNVPA